MSEKRTDMSDISNYTPKATRDFSSWNKALLELELSGTLVIFDITDSTKLKGKKEFPIWVSDWYSLNGTIIAAANRIGAQWYKFLGDAFLFFFLDEENSKYPHLAVKNPKDVFDFCHEIMQNIWDEYKCYKRNEKGSDKHVNYREITCAIDHGKGIINWYNAIDDNDGGKFDPIGPTVDRCFRISSIAGPNQTLCSRQFYEKLVSCDPSLEANFLKFHIAQKTLKGFDDETIIYYSIPCSEQVDYILEDANVDLVENSRTMAVKEKLHLFRHTRKIHDRMDGGTNEEL